jgi:DNA-binding transcriptional MerR regulator
MAGQKEKSTKVFYSMGEVAEMLDVSHSLVRYWEKHFDILKPTKNKKGNRMFSPEDLRNLKTIYHLVKERGMTLAGAQKYMKASRHQIERDMELAERLATIRSLLAEVRDALGTDGTVMEEVFQEEELFREPPASAPEPESTPKPTPEPDQTSTAVVAEPFASEPEDEPEAEDDEPEEMPDFNPEPVFAEEEEDEEDEPSEPQTEEPPKPLFIEQTLFDF